MKTSVEWLKEYCDIDIDTIKLGDILTMTGTKVETIDELGKDIKNVVVGKIEKIEKHPDADKLVVTKVNVGNEIIQIVTGAKNVNVGDVIPVAKSGAKLPNGIEIKKGKLRSVESEGMMCSIGELNLTIEDYPNQIEDGIMMLGKENEKNIGKDVIDVLNLREDIFDFEITPNRPDCLSAEGLGREVAVSLNKKFKNPRKNIDEMKIEDKKEIEGLKVDVEAPDLCHRYIARIATDIKIGESPEWMKRRLKACGIRSINNIVDITNYVMLELGQPLHAFDINNINDKHIVVRRAKNNEKIITLDDEEKTLNEDDLVIADNEKPIAIAGIMGGKNSGINEETKTIVFESAIFNRGSVRMTSKKVGLRTESSSRFEKGLSTENAIRAINRAIELVELISAGKAVDGKIDIYSKKQEINHIKINEDRINSLLGTNISKKEMIDILNRLEMKVEDNVVTPPYFRMDVEQEADIAEEVLRFYGYDKLETSLIKGDTTVGVRTKSQKITDSIRDYLAHIGLYEIYTYGFISEKDIEKSNINKEKSNSIIEIINPLSEDYKLMRPSTIPSMMQILALNLNRKNNNVKLFDISRTYKNTEGQIEKGEIPVEETILTIGMYGDNIDFYSLKGLVENINQIVGVDKYSIEKETDNASYHPGRCAKFKVGIDSISTFGEVHPQVLTNFGIKTRVYLAEINITKMVKYAKSISKYVEVPKFPAVERDLAIVVDETVAVGDIENIISKKGKKLLESIKLFDIYRDEKLGENKKSVAFSLMFRDKKKTLQDDEVNDIMEQIISEVKNKLNAELRI